MFKIPQWEEDVPKTADTFKKKIKDKKKTLPNKLLAKSNISNKNSIQNGSTNYRSKSASTTIKNLGKNKNLKKSKDMINGTRNNSIIKNCINTIGNKKTKEEQKNNNTYTNRRKKCEFSNKRNVAETTNKKKNNTGFSIVQKNLKESEEISKHENSLSETSINISVDGRDSKKINEKPNVNLNKDSNLKNNNLERNTIGMKRKNKAGIKIRGQATTDKNLEDECYDSDVLDEVMINAKKKKLTEAFEKDDQEHLLFWENDKTTDIVQKSPIKTNNNIVSKSEITNNDNTRKINGGYEINKKKAQIKKLLDTYSNRNSINVSGSNLRIRMLERLKAAQFRYLNEKLYTSSGEDAHKLFKNDPVSFKTYHEGYQQQLKKWPVNPLDVIVKKIQKMPKSHTIADMGCGEAALSKRVPHAVRSFDLVASGPGVEECDMAHTPLLAASVDVAVYCLALMGTDLTQYLVEANRVLKMGGLLLIAEVESRFGKVEDFIKGVERLGFKMKKLDKNNEVFFFMEFTKIRDPPVKKNKLPVITLKPCFYKKR